MKLIVAEALDDPETRSREEILNDVRKTFTHMTFQSLNESLTSPVTPATALRSTFVPSHSYKKMIRKKFEKSDINKTQKK